MALYDINSRTKTHLNVGTIGHGDHGKSSLTVAIAHVLAEQGKAKAITLDDLDNSPDEKAAKTTIDTARVDYSTDARHYTHTDCPGVPEFTKNTFIGLSQIDTAILVVAANSILKAQAREHVQLARQAGVSNIVCFLNKMDKASEASAQLIEKAVRRLLSEYGFDGSQAQVIRGSALEAVESDKEIGKNAVLKLLDALDSIPAPVRALDQPFAMAVKEVLPVEGFGIKVVGRIDQGIVRPGDEVEFVGIKPTALKTTVTGVESFQQPLTEGQAGDSVELLIPGLKRDAVERGQVVCAPGSKKAVGKFKAGIHVLTKEKGGRETPFKTNYKLQFFFRTADVAGTVKLPEGVEAAKPGDNINVTVELSRPVALEPGVRFAMHEVEMTVGMGEVTEIIA